MNSKTMKTPATSILLQNLLLECNNLPYSPLFWEVCNSFFSRSKGPLALENIPREYRWQWWVSAICKSLNFYPGAGGRGEGDSENYYVASLIGLVIQEKGEHSTGNPTFSRIDYEMLTIGFFINWGENGYRLLVCVFDPDQDGDGYRLSGVRIVISKLLYDFFRIIFELPGCMRAELHARYLKLSFCWYTVLV